MNWKFTIICHPHWGYIFREGGGVSASEHNWAYFLNWSPLGLNITYTAYVSTIPLHNNELCCLCRLRTAAEAVGLKKPGQAKIAVTMGVKYCALNLEGNPLCEHSLARPSGRTCPQSCSLVKFPGPLHSVTRMLSKYVPRLRASLRLVSTIEELSGRKSNNELWPLDHRGGLLSCT
jgi:hypothetical protein